MHLIGIPMEYVVGVDNMEQNFCVSIITMYGLILNGEVGGRTHFAQKFHVSERSISVYIKYLQEDLNVKLHYDKKLKKYIIDEQGIFKMLKLDSE